MPKDNKEKQLDLFAFLKMEFAKNPKTGERGLKLIGFKDIKTFDELNKKYTKTPPYFYLNNSKNAIYISYISKNNVQMAKLTLGDWINFDDFCFYYQQILKGYYKLFSSNKDYEKLFTTLFSSEVKNKRN
jgi:hypothetical protein